jgi:hypothetical protein
LSHDTLGTKADWIVARNAKVADFYQALELNAVIGKRLRDETRDYVKSSPFAFLFEKRGWDQLATKTALTDAAFYMLVNEGWGTKWFGPDCETTQTRTLFWPANSTLLAPSASSLTETC